MCIRDRPRDGVVSRLVVQVNGSGPQTCNTFRDRGDGTTYSFCGFFGEELAGRGLGFFCYSTRGCTCLLYTSHGGASFPL